MAAPERSSVLLADTTRAPLHRRWPTLHFRKVAKVVRRNGRFLDLMAAIWYRSLPVKYVVGFGDIRLTNQRCGGLAESPDGSSDSTSVPGSLFARKHADIKTVKSD
jgi:hypothetical protein